MLVGIQRTPPASVRCGSEGVTKTHMSDPRPLDFSCNFLVFLYRVVVPVQHLQSPSKTFTHREIAWILLDNFVQVDYCFIVFTLCLCMLSHRAQGRGWPSRVRFSDFRQASYETGRRQIEIVP